MILMLHYADKSNAIWIQFYSRRRLLSLLMITAHKQAHSSFLYTGHHKIVSYNVKKFYSKVNRMNRFAQMFHILSMVIIISKLYFLVLFVSNIFYFTLIFLDIRVLTANWHIIGNRINFFHNWIKSNFWRQITCILKGTVIN